MARSTLRKVPGWVSSGSATPFPLGGVQRKVKVGSPGDAAEHEAERTADHVTSGSSAARPEISRLEVLQREAADKRAQEPSPRDQEVHRTESEKKEPAVQRLEHTNKEEPAVQRRCDCPEEQMQHRASGTASVRCKVRDGSSQPVDMDGAAEYAISTKDTGAPLRPMVRQTLESRMGVDLSTVRVHEGPAAQESSAALNARAFTHQNDIWLGRGESQENLHLMAHEATHVVQQGAAARRTPDAPQHEDEDQPVVRRSLWGDITGVAGAVINTAGQVVDAAGNVIARTADFFWQLVQKLAPGLVPIFQEIRAKGIVGYLRDKLSGAFNGIFGGRASGGGFIAGLIKTFASLASSAQDIVAALGRGDCQPLLDAVSRLGHVLSQIAGDAWDKIKEFFAPLGDFFSDLGSGFGAPVIDFLEKVASETWESIKATARQIWDVTQPVRDELGAAWKWIKDQLGVGDEPDGQNGLLQWVQGKLGEAWAWVKDQLQPVIGPMKALVDDIKTLIPLDAILNLRVTVHEWLEHTGEMIQKMGAKKGVTQNAASLRETILPAIKAAVGRVAGRISSAGSWVSRQIGGIVLKVTGFFSSLRGNSILGKVAGAIQWIQDKVNALGDWVQNGVQSVFNTVGKGVRKLGGFIEPVLGVLQKIVSVITNVVKELPGLVLGPVWKMIPACIRDPIKDFIVEHILGAIPVISAFLKIPDIWSKIQKMVMDFLSQVFVDGDLGGAALTVIRFVLGAAGVDFDLMLSVLGKAAGALDNIIMHPVEFLSHLLAALKKGFGQFLDNILRHIRNGLLEWIHGPLEDLGVTPPKDFSLPSLLNLALQILGITGDKLHQKLENVIGRGATKILDEAWKWISALTSGGPAKLWEEIKGRLSNLWDMVIGGITSWITENVVRAGIQELTLLSNPVGAVIEAIKTIYTTIQFVVTKMNKILMVVNAVLDSINKIIAGDVKDAANWIESALARSVAPVLSFFADWLSIESPAPEIRKIVLKIQDKVDQALDWLVDKAKGIARSVLGARGLGEKPDDRTPQEKQADLDSAMSEATSAAKELDANSGTVEAKLPAIKKRYRLNVLELRPQNGRNFDIHGELNPTADAIVPLKPGEVPDSAEPVYGGVSPTLGGTSMKVEPLTNKHKAGSAPSSSPGVWDKVRPDALKRDGVGLYVRGHLLNRRLGGPGTDPNLTPITYSANATHYQDVESDVVELVNEKKGIVGYQVGVLPPAPKKGVGGVIAAELELTSGLRWSWWELKATGGDAQHPQLAKTGKGKSDVVKNVPDYPHPELGGIVSTAVRRATAPSSHTPLPTTPGAQPLPAESVSLDSGKFEPSPAWQQAFQQLNSRALDVPVRYRRLALGTIRVSGSGKQHNVYSTHRPQPIALTHAFLEPLGTVGIHPVLVVSINNGLVQGYVTQSLHRKGKESPQDPSALFESIRKNAAAMGWPGMEVTGFPSRIRNEFKSGVLNLAVPKFNFRLAFLNGDGSFELNGEQVAFRASAVAKVPGLDPVILNIDRSAAGQLYGSASVPLKFKRFTGAIQARYKNGLVEVGGTASYLDEKLSGAVTFLVTDAATAQQVALEHLGVDAIKAAAGQDAPSQARREAKGVAIAGWGHLTFRFTDWLKGTADVVVDGQGHITVIGEIRPDKEVPLMAPKPFHKNLVTLPIQAEYGLPYVGGIGLEADIILDFNATVGPAKLYDIVAAGRYSTDPRIAREFTFTGSFNLSAYAELALTANGSLVVTILSHDIKAGAGITATAGARGYVDARPTVGYREKLSPEEGGKGEFYFKGHAEMAAQAYLGLEGHLFIQLNAPWWSPISDHYWPWPVGSLEYVLGDIGIGMDVDHVIGSGKVPDVQFGKVSFDSDKFMSDVLDDKVPSKSKGEQKGKTTWRGVEPEKPVPAPGPKAIAPPKAAGPKKPAIGRQTAKQSKASDPAAAKAWKTALADLRALAESSRNKPLGPSELENAIATFRKRHNFTKLNVASRGEEWVLHAEVAGVQGSIRLKRRGDAANSDDRTPEQKQADLNSAMSEAEAASKESDATADEVEEKLPGIKKRYRLNVLVLRPLADGDFDLHGELNPKKDDRLPPFSIKIEGEAGAYKDLVKKGKRKDRITPDHEPQHALMSYVSDLTTYRFAGFRKPFQGTPVEKYSHGEGVCLNMFVERHYKTRTYGASPKAAIDKIRTSLNNDLPPNSPVEKVQNKVKDLVNEELAADQKRVKEIYASAKVPQGTKNRVEEGSKKVKSLNRDWWL